MSMCNDRSDGEEANHFTSIQRKTGPMLVPARENPVAITHSPYYGCTIRVRSKANVSYEGVLDGISVNKDRLYLKHVRVKGNTTNDDLSSILPDGQIDRLNEVMINHLINDLHIYDEVCLNVRDVQEMKLLQAASSFEKSKEKLRSIDPCLVDIRLSSSDRDRRESIGPLSSSTESTSSSWDNLPQLSSHLRNKPNTLLAKKVLSKRKSRPNSSPVRITITSKLNPDAAPFFAPQRSTAPPGPTRVRYPPRFVPPRHERLSVPNLTQLPRPANSLRATDSVPYQQRGPRVSLESARYDFEKANAAFRRYSELEKNRQTFGDDAFLFPINDADWSAD